MALIRSRSRVSPTVRLFFATDIHGSEICWGKFLSAASFYDADVLILGGDFTGKLMIPVVPQPDGRYSARFLGKEHFLGLDELPRFERRVADSGFYPIRMDTDRVNQLGQHPEEVTALFEELIIERLKQWISLAKGRLRGTGVRILTAPANDDPYCIDQVIAEHGEDVFVNVEGQVVDIAPGHEMISTGRTNRTPWNTPREFDEEDIASHIDEMVSRVSNVENAVFNIHPPPYGTKLDPAPKLTEDLEVVTSTGKTVMEHVGSVAALEALQRHQPLLSLHGHIHESAGLMRVGRTTAVNPGSEYGEGVLKGALIQIGGGRIHSVQATSG